MKPALFLAFILVANYCHSQEHTTDNLINFSTNRYMLQFPKSWSIDTARTLGAALFVFSPLEDETDRFRENVNLLIQNLNSQNIDLEKYKEITEKQIKDLATDGKIMESSIKKSALGEVFKITYTMTQGTFRIKITSICLINKGQAYLVTFSSELTKYDKYIKTGEQILSSFSLKE